MTASDLSSRIITPMVNFLNRLTFPRKFALIGSVLTLPLGLLAYFLVRDLNERIQFSEKELLGTEYLRPLQHLAFSLRERREVTWIRPDPTSPAAELQSVAESIKRNVDAVDAVDRRFGTALDSTPMWTALKTQIESLRGAVSTVAPVEMENRFTALLSDLTALQSHVGDQSNLILDPDLDSYYAMDLIVNQIPLLAEQLGQLRGFSGGLVGRGSAADLEQFRVRNLEELIEVQEKTLKHHFGVMLRKTQDPSVKASLEPVLLQSIGETNRFLAALGAPKDSAAWAGVTTDGLWQQGSKALGEIEQLCTLTSISLDRLLQTRVSGFKSRRTQALWLTFSGGLLGAFLFAGFYLAIMRTVHQLEAAAQRLLERRWADAHLEVATKDELGQVIRSFGALAKRLESEWTALQESEVRTRLVVDNALDAVITMNEEGNIVGWNTQAESIFGWTKVEAIGRTLADTIVPPRFREAHTRGLLHFLRTGEGPVLNKRIEIGAMHRDGHEFPAELTICPVKVDDRYLFSAFVRDITEQRRAKAELEHARDASEEANRAKSQFLATMSHEIRTPINGILGFAELLQETPLNEQQKTYAGTIKDAGENLLVIVNDILDISKIEAGKMTLELVPFDLERMIGEVVTLLSNRTQEKRLEIRVEYPDSLPRHLVADPVRVRQILTNIAGNALKFTEQGSVTIRVSGAIAGAQKFVRIGVQDTGIGISKEQQAKLFQKFSQADSSTTRRFGGSGLGLVIYKELTELMGGQVGIESEPGRGSTFWFSFPLLEAEACASANPEAGLLSSKETPGTNVGDVPDWSKLRVLLAEDNVVNQMFVLAVLGKWKCQTEVAATGLEAVEHFKTGTHDIIFMDCHMPEMDGFAATKEIRKLEQTEPGRVARTPIIAITASAMQEDHDRCMAAGMDAVLTKPVRARTLQQAIQRWGYDASQ